MKTRLIPLLTGDVAGALLAIYLTSLFLVAGAQGFSGVFSLNPVFTGLFVGGIMLSSFGFELYNNRRSYQPMQILRRVLVLVVLFFSAITIVRYAGALNQTEWLVASISLVGFGIFQCLWHCVYHKQQDFFRFNDKILVLGTGPLARDLGEMVQRVNPKSFLGYVSAPNEQQVVKGKDVVDSCDSLLESVQRLGATKVVVSLADRRGVFPLQDLLSCKLSGVQVLDAPSFYEETTGRLLLENITPGWFIFSNGFRVTTMVRLLKRSLDISTAVVGLTLTAPLLPLLAGLIKLSSPGPVLFSQIRVGQGDLPFTIYKFRTMRQDAEAKTGAVWSQKNDPRITRLGKFMRKTRLDEIPQLYNILKGDMSLVGPRPERPEFVKDLKEIIPYYSERHYVKPGLTGWAQVCYPYGSSVEDAIEKLRYDLFYIKNISFWMDIKVIFKTVGVVLSGKGGR